MRSRQNFWLFGMVCLIWGLTWIPIRVGVDAMSPSMFAASRIGAAGAILLIIAILRGSQVVPATRDVAVIFLGALLTNALAYGLLFWGVGRVDTGLAAVVNLSVTPLAFLGIGVLFKADQFSGVRLLTCLLGATGIAVLLAEKLGFDASMTELLGLCAVAAAAVSFAGGAVLARQLVAKYSALVVNAWFSVLGGLLLGSFAVAAGLSRINELSMLTDAQVLWPWLYLVIPGSIVAHTAFYRLSAVWAPSTAGLYALVSPVIAVIAGVLIMDERISVTEAIGMLVLLATTAIGLWSTPRVARA